MLLSADPSVSRRHCVVTRAAGGRLFVRDLSTNGVYVNDERKPIGKGNLRRLFNGDHLHMGDFEIEVVSVPAVTVICVE